MTKKSYLESNNLILNLTASQKQQNPRLAKLQARNFVPNRAFSSFPQSNKKSRRSLLVTSELMVGSVAGKWLVEAPCAYLLLYATMRGGSEHPYVHGRPWHSCIAFFGRKSSWWRSSCAGPDSCLAYKHTGYACIPALYCYFFEYAYCIFAILFSHALFTLLYFALLASAFCIHYRGVRVFPLLSDYQEEDGALGWKIRLASCCCLVAEEFFSQFDVDDDLQHGKSGIYYSDGLWVAGLDCFCFCCMSS